MSVSAQDQKVIRACIRGAYDLQELRVQTGQRLAASWYAKQGRKPSEKKEDMDKEAQSMLKILKESYNKITDGFANQLPSMKRFKGDELISSYAEFTLVDAYIGMEQQEERQMKNVSRLVEQHPLWNEFLVHVKGCGSTMAAVLLSVVDIEKAKYPGHLWKLAGLDIGPDGRGRSRRSEHLVNRTYIDKQGQEKEKKSITYNPFFKTKMVGVLSDCIMKAGSGQKYRKIYDDYKWRLKNHRMYGAHNDGEKIFKTVDGEKVEMGHCSPMRRHRMALRYMTKEFLADVYRVWRRLEGLSVDVSYHVAKLGYDEHKLPLNLDDSEAVNLYDQAEDSIRRRVCGKSISKEDPEVVEARRKKQEEKEAKAAEKAKEAERNKK